MNAGSTDGESGGRVMLLSAAVALVIAPTGANGVGGRETDSHAWSESRGVARKALCLAIVLSMSFRFLSRPGMWAWSLTTLLQTTSEGNWEDIWADRIFGFCDASLLRNSRLAADLSLSRYRRTSVAWCLWHSMPLVTRGQ